MVVQVDLQGVGHRVEFMVGQLGEEVSAGPDSIECQVGRWLDPVVLQSFGQDTVIKTVVVGDNQLFRGKEVLDMLPYFWEDWRVGNVTLVNAVNLSVAP